MRAGSPSRDFLTGRKEALEPYGTAQGGTSVSHLALARTSCSRLPVYRAPCKKNLRLSDNARKPATGTSSYQDSTKRMLTISLDLYRKTFSSDPKIANQHRIFTRKCFKIVSGKYIFLHRPIKVFTGLRSLKNKPGN